MKFEAIITYSDLAILADKYGITYKNPRVAVSGIICRLRMLRCLEILLH